MEFHGKTFSHGRRLFELLEEQQEPFLLEVYLLENGYSRNLLKSDQAKAKCWPVKTCRKLFGFSSGVIKTRRGGKLLSCVLSKLVHWKLIIKALNLESRVLGVRSRSVLSCFTAMGIEARAIRFRRLLNSCEEILDGTKHWKSMENSKKHSPVSVFELHSNEACSAHYHSMEEEKLSTSSLNSDISEEPQYFNWFSKLHQDENGRKEPKERIWGSHYSLSNGRKCMEMQVFSLEKHRKEVARIAKLIDVDLSGTRREWSHFKDGGRKIGLEIERLIFEEIREELVVEMFGSHCLLKSDSF
ncbi:hypothetical protein IEQ34_001992 [Dendrobium chrysotoxum]|uniref:DUF4378 domain-containing protein n=1 Tax=Dendrobium chrysotoxum TaxID=161865 RepID=A0AAV7HKT2_DENCH|nr:hypothetical protein IEQ34_001992 [Dendrobium chrysotoxum]